MRIILATVKVPFIRGGAEVLAERLCAELVGAGHQAEIAAIPFKWYPPATLADHMLAGASLDFTAANGRSIDLVIGLKFPAYLAQNNKMNLWLVHQHRQAYDLWDSGQSELRDSEAGRGVRDLIERADRNAMSSANRRFSISKNVSARLHKYCGIESTPVYHPPLNDDLFHSGTQGDYVFFPSRIGEMKRQLLAIEAMALVRSNARLVIAGAADNEEYLGKLQKAIKASRLKKRVELLGEITEARKIELYAGCLGVLYPPQDEDYGYVSLEAMLSSKPVVTCTDSGGPLEFVRGGETGLVAEANPRSVANAIDQLYDDRAIAARLGEAGRQYYDDLGICWQDVTRQLTQ